MATIIGRTNSSYWTFKLETSEGAYDLSNNTSPVTVGIYIGRTSSAGGSYMQGADINITVGCTGCNSQTVRYRNTGRVDIASGGWLLVGTVTFPAVPHNSDGAKIVYISSSFTQSVVSPSSGSAGDYVTLSTIPRQATITWLPASFNDEGNLTINYTNPTGNPIQACISYDKTERGIRYENHKLDPTGEEYTFNFTQAEREEMQLWVLNKSTKRTVYVYICTEMPDDVYYDEKPIELEIVNCAPTFNPTIVAYNTEYLTGNPLTIVRHKSVVTVNSGAAGVKQASISPTSQFIRAGGQTLNSGSGEMTSLTNGYFEFKATDNRGVLGSHEHLVETFVDYSLVTCSQNVSVGLESGDSTKVQARMTLSGVYFNGKFGRAEDNAKDNSLSLYRRIKPANTDWSEQSNEGWVEITDNIEMQDGKYTCETDIAGLDYKTEYIIQCMAQDKLHSSFSNEYRFQTRPVFDWGANDFNFNVPVMFKGGLTPIEIPRYTDLNTITTPGLYRCLLNVDVATLSNCPATVAFIMEVLPNNSITQRITEHEVSRQPRTYMRNHYNNKWCKWYEYGTILNTLGSAVNLFSKDLSDADGGYYEFPCDGYLVARASYRAGYYISFVLYGSAADAGPGIDICVTSGSSIGMQGNPTNAIFVRKGMIVMSLYTNDTTYNVFQFFPLT